ncbi:hypothetical protein LGH82_03660 [Mesorhizobium sp. PAMC28654]|uniref:COG3904 family protein n=1 Tax=Mesorhizobium sp. PAMC28654 TaxID=2880934 RepID=UPI001D0BBCA7|nr:hypothetical protein [Mesorhizobium sp. PAMC28654]UDL90472.1 hypothetical protein LGH82_03660 [Mesorhizobium sp. PAMC28654]
MSEKITSVGGQQGLNRPVKATVPPGDGISNAPSVATIHRRRPQSRTRQSCTICHMHARSRNMNGAFRSLKSRITASARGDPRAVGTALLIAHAIVGHEATGTAPKYDCAEVGYWGLNGMLVGWNFHRFAIPFVVFVSSLASSEVSALEFSAHFNGAARIDGESTWIYADGPIELHDTEKFEKFLEDTELWKNQRVVLNSPGGSVLEGIRLGELIRSRGFRTAVAKTAKDGDYSRVEAGICASSCVLAFVGGIQRGASEGSRVGIHQLSVDFENIFSQRNVTVDDLIANFSDTQKVMSLVLKHFMAMGIDPGIVPMMAGTSSSDIRWLTAEEAKNTKIAYEPEEFAPWVIEPYGKGLVAFSKSNDGKKQLTLFCKNGHMRFLLRAEGSPYSTTFSSDVGGLKGFEIVGAAVVAPDFKLEVKNDTLELSGSWNSTGADPKYHSTFSLYGKVVGSISDIYSLYHFNPARFDKSVNLARKNCV